MTKLQWRDDGGFKMIDVSSKNKTLRTAQASGKILMSEKTLDRARDKKAPKGDVFAVAKTAGILAAKKTPEAIVLCHPIAVSHCEISFALFKKGIKVTSLVKTFDRTGAEMEALSAVSAALLNIYDMLKAIDKSMLISDIKLLRKTGGKSDDFKR